MLEPAPRTQEHGGRPGEVVLGLARLVQGHTATTDRHQEGRGRAVVIQVEERGSKRAVVQVGFILQHGDLGVQWPKTAERLPLEESKQNMTC